MKKREQLFDRATKELLKKKPNYKVAIQLMEKSFKNGYIKAGYALGTWYFHGHIYDKNISKGIKLIKDAAKANIKEALFDLAVCYETGIGAKKNNIKAFEYYLRAALQDDKQAYNEVGRLFYYGVGVPKNKRIANIWFDKAESLGTYR
jgi:TPR repeat protein